MMRVCPLDGRIHDKLHMHHATIDLVAGSPLPDIKTINERGFWIDSTSKELIMRSVAYPAAFVVIASTDLQDMSWKQGIGAFMQTYGQPTRTSKAAVFIQAQGLLGHCYATQLESPRCDRAHDMYELGRAMTRFMHAHLQPFAAQGMSRARVSRIAARVFSQDSLVLARQIINLEPGCVACRFG